MIAEVGPVSQRKLQRLGLRLCPSCLWRPQLGVWPVNFSCCSSLLTEVAWLSQLLPPKQRTGSSAFSLLGGPWGGGNQRNPTSDLPSLQTDEKPPPAATKQTSSRKGLGCCFPVELIFKAVHVKREWVAFPAAISASSIVAGLCSGLLGLVLSWQEGSPCRQVVSLWP